MKMTLNHKVLIRSEKLRKCVQTSIFEWASRPMCVVEGVLLLMSKKNYSVGGQITKLRYVENPVRRVKNDQKPPKNGCAKWFLTFFWLSVIFIVEILNFFPNSGPGWDGLSKYALTSPLRRSWTELRERM